MSQALNRLFLLLMLLLAACGPGRRGRVAATLDDVEAYINERPDSALAVLRGLDSTAVLRGPALRARAALLHSMALDKCYIDLQTDSILAPAIAWYSRHGDPDEKLKSLYYLGRLQYNARDYQRAIVTYTEALELTDKAADMKYIGLVNQALADTYSATYQESESFPYLDRAYEAFLAIADTSLAKKTMYKETVALVRQKRWKDAEALYEKLEGNPRGIENILPMVRSDHALLLVLEGEGRAQEAVALFQDIINVQGSLPSLNHWGAYAYALLKTGNRTQADALFRTLEDQYPDDNHVQYWLIYEKKANNLYNEAYNLTYQTMVSQDSLMRIQLNHSTIVAQKEYLDNRTMQIQRESLRKNRILWIVIVLFVFVLLIGWSIVRLRIRATQREQARLQKTIDTIQMQLKVAENENSEFWRQQFTSLFQAHFNTLGKLCADYEDGLADRSAGADRTVLRQIDRIVADFKGDVDGHKSFEQILNRYFNGIMSSFRKDFSKLKQTAYLLVSYFFAGIDTATISLLMGLDVDVLYARKYRLKKMIAASKAPRKEEYIALIK